MCIILKLQNNEINKEWHLYCTGNCFCHPPCDPVQLPRHLHKSKASHAVRLLLFFFFGSDWTRWFPMLNNYDSMLFILFAVVNFLFFCQFSHHTLRKLLVKLKKTLPLLFHLWVTLKDLSYINYSMSMYFLFPLSHNAYRIPTLLRLLICSKCSYPGKKQYWMWQQSSAFECMKVVTSEIWVGKIDLLNWLPQNNFKNPHGFPTQKIC